MVSCNDFLAALGDYLEGETPSELRRQLEQHLAHCITCQVITDSTAKTLKVVTDSGEFDLSEELPEKVIDEIMDRVKRAQPRSSDPEIEEESDTE